MSRLAIALLLGLVVALVSANAPSLRWNQWKTQFNKQYTSETEELRRMGIFYENLAYIEQHNAHSDSFGFQLAMNKFGDLQSSEFASIYNGLRLKQLRAPNTPAAPNAPPSLPVSIDWRQSGVVTGIKNQGQCGSCWSFSATGSMEGAHALATKNLTSLSEENLVQCSQKEGDQGCNGGLMDDAFQYVITNKGIDTEASYPYTSGNGQTGGPCAFKKVNIGATISSFKDVTSGSESALQVAVGTIGPVSVAIDASHQSFQFYSGGIYYEPACSSTQLDHGVLSVGYGANSTGTQFWLVKNSWGTDWGLAGYIMMSRNHGNNCGIATAASYPIV